MSYGQKSYAEIKKAPFDGAETRDSMPLRVSQPEIKSRGFFTEFLIRRRAAVKKAKTGEWICV
jgi:hypothetical protein